jgi:hypothetical protein
MLRIQIGNWLGNLFFAKVARLHINFWPLMATDETPIGRLAHAEKRMIL